MENQQKAPLEPAILYAAALNVATTVLIGTIVYFFIWKLAEFTGVATAMHSIAGRFLEHAAQNNGAISALLAYPDAPEKIFTLALCTVMIAVLSVRPIILSWKKWLAWFLLLVSGMIAGTGILIIY